MAKLPEQKKIQREDLIDAPDWIDNLIQPINQFMETTYFALNKDITFQDNIASQIREIDFTTKSDYTTASPKEDGFEPVNFLNQLRTSPRGVLLIRLEEVADQYKIITEPTHVDWRFVEGSVRINYITGLKDSQRYKATLLVI